MKPHNEPNISPLSKLVVTFNFSHIHTLFSWLKINRLTMVVCKSVSQEEEVYYEVWGAAITRREMCRPWPQAPIREVYLSQWTPAKAFAHLPTREYGPLDHGGL